MFVSQATAAKTGFFSGIRCGALTLAQLAPRSDFGVHVIALKRHNDLTGGDAVELPGPQTRLVAGDRRIVIGQFEGIAAFMAALATDFSPTTD